MNKLIINNISASGWAIYSNADVVPITPNPASSFVNIYMSKNNNSLSQVIVTDANGKVVNNIRTADQTYLKLYRTCGNM